MLNYYNSFPSVTECTFFENTAGRGGGMYNFNYSSPVVSQCTFSGNSSRYNGGGLFNRDSSPILTGCTFLGNSAAINGGGMYNVKSSEPMVTNCTFPGNSAEDYGGGMFNRDSSPILTNCTFSENTTGKNGGGMGNADNSRPVVMQCILWDDGPPEIHDDGSGRPVMAYCVVRGWTGGGDGNISEDPRLDGLADNGGSTRTYALKSGSPAIDAGLSVGTHTVGNIFVVVPDKDQRGVDRPQGSGVDIGAYEVPQEPKNDPQPPNPKPDPNPEPEPSPSPNPGPHPIPDPQPIPEPGPAPSPEPKPGPNGSESSGGGCDAGWSFGGMLVFGLFLLRRLGTGVLETACGKSGSERAGARRHQ